MMPYTAGVVASDSNRMAVAVTTDDHTARKDHKAPGCSEWEVKGAQVGVLGQL